MAALVSTQLTAGAPSFAHGAAGNVKYAIASVTVPIGTAAADTVSFFDLPAGARVLSVTLSTTIAAGAALTMNIGDAGSATRYLAATTLNNTSVTSSALSTAIGYVTTAVTRVQGVFAGTTSTIASPIVVIAQFVMEPVAS